MAQLKDTPTPKIVKPPTPNVLAKKAPPERGVFAANVRAALQSGYTPATSLAIGNIPSALASTFTPQALAQLRGVPVVTQGNLGLPEPRRGGGRAQTYRGSPWAAAYQAPTSGSAATIFVSPEARAGQRGDLTRLLSHEYGHAYTNIAPPAGFADALRGARLPTALSGFNSPGGGSIGYASAATPAEAYAEIGSVPSQIPRSLISFYPQYNASALPSFDMPNLFKPARQPAGQRNAFGSNTNQYSLPAFKKVQR